MDIYDLDELIERLEEIREKGDGNLNFPKAIYCLAKEIQEIKTNLHHLHATVPTKYKKFNPKRG